MQCNAIVAMGYGLWGQFNKGGIKMDPCVRFYNDLLLMKCSAAVCTFCLILLYQCASVPLYVKGSMEDMMQNKFLRNVSKCNLI